MKEVAPALFGVRCAGEALDTLLDEVADAAVFAGIEPPAVEVFARVEFERVGAVVEGDHGLLTDGTVEFALAFCVLDHPAAGVFLGRGEGLKLVELVMVEPTAVALRATIHLDSVLIFDGKGYVAAWAFHASRVQTDCFDASKGLADD
jgi:hypothetical protein